MKKRIFGIIGILLIVCAAGAGGWYYYRNYIQSSDENSVYVSKVSTLMGTSSGVENRYAGVVEAQETVEVTIDSGRKVREVQVSVGEEVKAGQLLFEYDLSSLEEDLQEAELELAQLQNEAASLTEQIATLETEKQSASSDNQLSYTIEIETQKLNLQKNQYSQTSKEAEIESLQNATQNTEVRSEIDGIVQQIDTSMLSTDDDSGVEDTLTDDSSLDFDSDSSGTAFITILSTGTYRVKGTVNELQVSSIVEGDAVIIRSRVDEETTWRGTMGSVDMDNTASSSSTYDFYDSSSSSSTSYNFYVTLDSSDGLMLGQHVYIEIDVGQEDEKAGVWLSDFFIVDADTNSPYVWAADDNNRLEKREVILGQYDESLGEYEIADGLTEDDYIAFPTDRLEEGMSTVVGTGEETLSAMTEWENDSYATEGDYWEDDFYATEGDYIEDEYLYDEEDESSDGTYYMIEDDDTVFADEIIDEDMDEGLNSGVITEDEMMDSEDLISMEEMP